MKMTSEHFALLKKNLDRFIAQNGGEAWLKARVKAYETLDFPRAHLVKDLQVRFCFDMLFDANANRDDDNRYFLTDYTDENIFTALKKILPTVTRKI